MTGRDVLRAAKTETSTRDELLIALTERLALPADATRVSRYGRAITAPLQIHLADGRMIRFAEISHMLDGQRLAAQVVLDLGAGAPNLALFTRKEAQEVFTVAVKAADLEAEDDDRQQAEEWRDQARKLAHLIDADYENGLDRYGALRWLEMQPPYDPRTEHQIADDPSRGLPAIRWADGRVWVRARDVIALVRGGFGAALDAGRIIGRLREVGCEHRRADARKPSANRTDLENRARVSVIEVAKGVSPSVP